MAAHEKANQKRADKVCYIYSNDLALFFLVQILVSTYIAFRVYRARAAGRLNNMQDKIWLFEDYSSTLAKQVSTSFPKVSFKSAVILQKWLKHIFKIVVYWLAMKNRLKSKSS